MLNCLETTRKVQQCDPEDGAFHTIMTCLAVIGKMFGDAVLSDLFIEAGIVAAGSVSGSRRSSVQPGHAGPHDRHGGNATISYEIFRGMNGWEREGCLPGCRRWDALTPLQMPSVSCSHHRSSNYFLNWATLKHCIWSENNRWHCRSFADCREEGQWCILHFRWEETANKWCQLVHSTAKGQNLVKSKKTEAPESYIVIKADRGLFARMVVIAQHRWMSMQYVLKYPFGPLPWSIATPDGALQRSPYSWVTSRNKLERSNNYFSSYRINKNVFQSLTLTYDLG